MKFSSLELFELGKAWVALSLAFAILYTGGALFSPTFMKLFVISAVVVGSGFLLHELAHKFLAQRYGCWAEFRADTKMLLFMIAVSFFGFIFAAPGGVFLHGTLTRDKYGKISLVGPLMNIFLSIFFFILFFLDISYSLVSFGFRINAWLALFNLLPFWQLDGLKVLQWHKGVYSAALGGSLLLLFLSMFTP
ncbi:hypothetical protein HYS50_01725 [Candidatus Woesearchaeota archaeon]|nr:hypothetical protein [Candidatus Woesearchaeota archaeon]